MHSFQMTAGRRVVLARQARNRFAAHEREMKSAVDDALGELVDKLSRRFDLLTAVTAAAPLGGDDFTDEDADGIVAELEAEARKSWPAILEAKIMPTYKAMLDKVLHAGLSDKRVANNLIKWRNDWLAARTQILVGVPDSVTSELRTTLRDIAAKNGTSVEDARSAAQKMLMRGYPSWTNRAQTIAQTETVGANNQGSLASWTEIADATGSSETATKTWLATEDEKTRASHSAIDGTTVGLGEKFDLEGGPMNGPGDPDGDAGEVINCRCTMTYDFPDGSSETVSADDATVSDPEPSDPSVSDVAEVDPDVTAAADASTDASSGVAIMLGVGAGDEAALLGIDGLPTPDAPGLHCTLAGLSEPAASYSDEEIQSLISTLAALTPEIVADILGPAQFNVNDEEREPCVVLLVQSQALADLRDAVQTAIEQAGLAQSTAFPIWQPHVTLGYNIDPALVPDSAASGEISFNRIVLGLGGEQHVVAGDGAETQEPDPAGDDAADVLAAAQEADVTAPAPPATAPDATTPAPEATGGDTPAAGADLTPQGITWSGPIARLDFPSSDGRMIASTGVIVRPLPLPLSWQRESADGHDGKITVGRVLAAEVRTDPALGPIIWGTGDWLDPMLNFDAEQAMGLVDAGLGLVSVDLAPLEVGLADAQGNLIDPILFDGDFDDVVELALSAEFGGVTIVDFPAFGDVRIALDPVEEPTEDSAGGIIAGPLMEGPGMGTFAAGSPQTPTIADDGGVMLADGTTVNVGDPVDYTGDDGTTATGTIKSIDTGSETVTITPAPADDGTQPPDMSVPISALGPSSSAPPPKGDGVTAAAYEPQPYQPESDETVTCPSCGKMDSPDAKFCDQCGFKLEGADGVVVAGDGSDVAASLLASSAVRPYASKFFAQRKFDGPTPLTVIPETGEVFGHLAEAGTCHTGKLSEGKCVTMPETETGFSYFHLTPVITDEGSLHVGKVTLDTGHAASGIGFANAVRHYDNTGTQAAVVRAYRDEFGTQVAGQLVHDLPVDKIETLMRSPLSGDWRMMPTPTGGKNLELMAALAVNVPGFPVRPRAGMARDRRVGQLSLVAAGVVERGVTLDAIGLPSGASVSREDFEALVASAIEAVQRGRVVTPANGVEKLALRKARARLALSRR